MNSNFGLLLEFIDLILEDGTGSRLDAEEAEAKIKYDLSLEKLKQWDAEAAKKAAYVAKAREMGLNPEGEAARKKLKSHPEFSYDPKVLQAKRQTLQDEIEKARQDLASYSPLEAGPVTRRPGQPASNAVLPDPNAPRLARISDIKPNMMYRWDDKRWSSAIKNVNKKTGGIFGRSDKSGTGPGESQLAAIFGAKVQGGGTSFDLVTSDGRQWEVKGLESKSDTLRPGTEGRRAFAQTKRHLDSIMKQMKSFTSTAKKTDLAASLTTQEQSALSYVFDFVDNDYDEIVNKGEITFPRRKALRAALKAINYLKLAWSQKGAGSNIDTTIGMGGETVKVDKPTYIDVAKKIEKSTNVNLMQGMQGKELALANLKDPAFDNPSKFLDEWYESVDVNVVFEQVDGIFIVTPEGFFLAPKKDKNSLKNVFKFVKVTQGQPRFSYKYFSNDDETSASE